MSTELLVAATQRASAATGALMPAAIPEQRWVAANGCPMVLREVTARDRAALERFYAQLSPLARYQRFFSGQPGIPPSLLDVFSDPPRATHIGLVVTASGIIVADARLVLTLSGAAEIAAVVADTWQGRGLGRLLFRTLIALGAERGWERIRADYFSDNRRIIGLLREAGFALARDGTSAVFGSAMLATT